MNKSESKYFNTAVKFDEALLALLEQKPFEYITISEICQTAGVNRSTFYLHYENTADLLEETTRHVLGQFVSYFPADEQGKIKHYNDCDVSELNFIKEKYLHPYLSFIHDNQRIFATVLTKPGIFQSNLIFERLFDNIFDPILDRFHYPQDDRRYVMMFYLNGLTAIIREWLQEGCTKNIDEIAEIVRYCIFGRVDKWNILNSQC